MPITMYRMMIGGKAKAKIINMAKQIMKVKIYLKHFLQSWNGRLVDALAETLFP